jgi:hypothetical protein
MAYQLASPFAVHAIGMVERAFEQSPSAEISAILIDMYSRGGDHAKAKDLIETALATWPDSGTICLSALWDAQRRRDESAQNRYAERLKQIDAGASS